MQTFTDAKGRTWQVSVQVDSIRRVRKLANFDLAAPDIQATVERLTADPILMIDVVFAIVKPEADALKISDVDFGHAMGSDVILQAQAALLREVAAFTPSKKLRALFVKAVEEILSATEPTLAKAE